MPADRRVLVTGAAGRLGRAVVDELRRRGIQPAAVDRAGADLDGVPVRPVELTDPVAVRAAVAGCDAVVHLAAYPSPEAAAGEEVFANNTRATYHVLAAAAERGIGHVVTASSISAYGMTFAREPFSPRYVPIDEDHQLLPQDPYALSKQVDEATGAMFARTHPMAVVALRFHWVATAEAIRQRVARLASDPGYGKAPRELWGYVEITDAARACVAALGAPAGFHPLHVVAPDTLSGVPTAELLARFHPRTELRAALAGTASAWSSARTLWMLGFAPGWSWRQPATDASTP